LCRSNFDRLDISGELFHDRQWNIKQENCISCIDLVKIVIGSEENSGYDRFQEVSYGLAIAMIFVMGNGVYKK